MGNPFTEKSDDLPDLPRAVANSIQNAENLGQEWCVNFFLDCLISFKVLYHIANFM